MIHFQRTRNLLREFKFQDVFRELGWANPPRIPAPEFQVDSARYRFTPIAEQGGLYAFEVSDLTDGSIPPRATQLALKRQLTPLFAEHFLVFVNRARSSSLWLWVWRDDKTRKPVDQRFDRIQSGELLLQKLSGLFFDYDDLDEEGKTSIGQVLDRLNANFYAEKVTKRFYEEFRDYKDKFITFIKGIESLDNQKWYASVILNRLMFIYFIQQKRFLSNDPEYLQNKFDHCEDNGLNYYRDFLCPLFFQGFAVRSDERDAATNRLLGTVPYLDGGLFLEHPHLEADGKLQHIRIENAPFKRLLKFFGEWNWHLDERPLKNDREISPDVLGYIFEKYVNQKQMGAYYTKEDITEYISKSTIIPFIFDAAARKCPSAFSGDSAVWKLLQLDPDRYIYDAVKKGVEIPLPKEIEAGIKDVSKRDGWNKPAKEEFALPTEIWREVVARRQRYAEVRDKLAKGEVRDINELVTLNLDLCKFIKDVVEDCRDPELLTAIYYTIAGRVPDPEKQSNQEIQPGLSVLDITCGSGAFLFAALNILEPIYQACLSKMQEFLDAEAGNATRKHSHFRHILDEVAEHPNARYFILKSIVVNNLFGVDIMEEAVEICKLRLFLKLAAQVDADPNKENLGIEPLPDIDFNIRAGNTLVGYATRAEVEKSAESDMLRKMVLPKILEDAEDTDRAFKLFRQLQTRSGATAKEKAQSKSELQRRLTSLENQLNCFLAEDYQLGMSKKKNTFEAWLKSHHPFHWFIQFYGILNGGGFDVIIGNPPYVSSSEVNYLTKEMKGMNFPDIYALVVLRSLRLTSKSGRCGMIIPLSVTFSSEFGSLRIRLCGAGAAWFSSYDNIPAAIFAGVSQRCTIWIGDKGGKNCSSTPMYRWRSVFRQHLLDCLAYVHAGPTQAAVDGLPKHYSVESVRILAAIHSPHSKPQRHVINAGRMGGHPLGFSQAARNFISVFRDNPPYLDASTLKAVASSKIGYVSCNSDLEVSAAFVSLVGELYFYYWLIRGDGFDVTSWIIRDYLHCLDYLPDREFALLVALGGLLHERRFEGLVFKKNAGKYVGNFNFQGHFTITRRADLLILAGLGLGRNEALDLFDRVQRVLAINESAGEKGIPEHVKARFLPKKVDATKQHKLFREIDTVLAGHYGFTAEELDFILNYDIKYRLGRATETEEE